MENKIMDQTKINSPAEEPKSDRREALQKLGGFAAYAAPFIVLAASKKAAAATGTGTGQG